MFDRVVRWSVENRWFVVMGYVLVLIMGLVALRTVSLEVFPEFAPPRVVILTEAPGLSPEDLEALVTFPIESVVNGIPDVEALRSSSSIGLSVVVVTFTWGTDIYTNRQLVNERLQLAEERFPPGVKAPVMLPVTSAVAWMLKYALIPDRSQPASAMELRTLSDWEIKNRVLAVPGVAFVASIGGEVKQYQVLLSPEKLLIYDLSFDEVVEAVRGSNLNVPGGFLVATDQEYIVRGQGRVTSLMDIEQSVIAVREGVPITLGQLAEVKFGPEIKRGDGSLNGVPAVIGTISKGYGTDTLTTTYEVERVLDEIEQTLPDGVTMIRPVFRQASFIEAAVKNLNLALIEGAIIVTVVLLIFLMNLRASFISFVAMPISLIGGILVLQIFGLGINTMTLAGLAIAIGAVVDDAIIVVENVFRQLRDNRQQPNPTSSASVVCRAAGEMLNSIVYATLIVTLVFLPIFFLSGVEGRIFAPVGIAYIVTMFLSLAVALTLTPALCLLLLGRMGSGQETMPESVVVRHLKLGYRTILDLALARPRWTIGLAAGMLVAALSVVPLFGREFLPEFREGNYIVAVTTLPGTSLQESVRIGQRVQGILRAYPEVLTVTQRAGRTELDEDALPVNMSEFDVTLQYGERSPDELLASIRADLSQIPGIAVNIGQFISHRLDEVLSGVRAQVAIKIFGPDLEVLRRTGGQVRDILSRIEGVADLQLEPQIDVPQVVIKVNREAAARYGLTVQELGAFVEAAFNGIIVSQVLERQRTFDLLVRFDEASRNDIASLKQALVDTPKGSRIPLSQLADIVIEERPFRINRESVMRRIVVQCNVAGRDLNSLIQEAQEKITQAVDLPQGYFIEYGGQFKAQQAAQRTLGVLGLVVLLGIFMLLYKALGTVKTALLVMVNLPLALIGGVVAIALSGGVMSVPSMLGFIGVFGIAARNGVILISHIQHLIAEGGRTVQEALVQGSVDRLAPVLMTAVTTALGLLPLVIGDPVGKELERPLAWVILGGLFTSTLLNMLVIPTLIKVFGMEKGPSSET